MKNTQNPKNSSSTANQRIWLYGKHAVFAALANPLRKSYQLLITRNTHQELQEHEGVTDYKQKVKFFITDIKFIDELLPEGAVHQGIALETAPLPETDLTTLIKKTAPKPLSSLLVLDQVTDPHNVGAILRSAAAFGADAVIVTRRHSPQETATLAKSASGALEHIPLIRVSNLVSALTELKAAGYWCIGFDGDAKTTLNPSIDFPKSVLLLGAEGTGLRRLTREHADLMVRLPTTGAIKSLNVSNAAAIALYAMLGCKKHDNA